MGAAAIATTAAAALVAAFGIVFGGFSARAAAGQNHASGSGSCGDRGDNDNLARGGRYEGGCAQPSVQTGLAVLIESGGAAIRGRKVCYRGSQGCFVLVTLCLKILFFLLFVV